MGTFKIYKDAGLTEEQVGNIQVSQKDDGSSPPEDRTVWIGSTTANRKLQADSDPGVDQITVSITDSSPGSGHETTAVKLALSALGLDSAVAGDPLDIGVEVLSGVGNAVAVHMRFDDATQTVGTSTELGIETNVTREVAV